MPSITRPTAPNNKCNMKEGYREQVNVRVSAAVKVFAKTFGGAVRAASAGSEHDLLGRGADSDRHARVAGKKQRVVGLDGVCVDRLLRLDAGMQLQEFRRNAHE